MPKLSRTKDGRWGDKSTPKKDWNFKRMEDHGADQGEWPTCEMCLHQKCRASFVMEHARFPRELKVGTGCAGHMMGDRMKAERMREKHRRNRAESACWDGSGVPWDTTVWEETADPPAPNLEEQARFEAKRAVIATKLLVYLKQAPDDTLADALAEAGMTWPDILNVPDVEIESDDEDWADAIDERLAIAARPINERGTGFLLSLKEFYLTRGYLTEKQVEKLKPFLASGKVW